MIHWLSSVVAPNVCSPPVRRLLPNILPTFSKIVMLCLRAQCFGCLFTQGNVIKHKSKGSTKNMLSYICGWDKRKRDDGNY